MRAAVLHEYGVPRADEFEEPSAGGAGQAVVEVLVAGLNPVDVAICAGRFYAGKPPLPSVAGREGVGTLAGERVYFGAPIAPFGSMAERALIDPSSTYPVPDGVPDGVAVALGISGLAAWLALTWRAQLRPGEHVLVLAASGVLGQIAVQAAKLLGAARVVAAARSPEGLARCLELGADASVRLDEPGDLSAALAQAGKAASMWCSTRCGESRWWRRSARRASARALCRSAPARARRRRSPRRRSAARCWC
jgi:NADPH:quinone reductase-like Zn-dependent oxidoreductase